MVTVSELDVVFTDIPYCIKKPCVIKGGWQKFLFEALHKLNFCECNKVKEEQHFKFFKERFSMRVIGSSRYNSDSIFLEFAKFDTGT